MAQSSTYELTNSNQAAEREAGLSIGLVILLIFAFFRPIATSIHHVGSVSILDIFGIGSSYLIIVGILTSIRDVRLNAILLLMLFFSFYGLLSMLWGSEYRELVRMVFPFLPFVLASAVVKSPNDIEKVLYAIILGYTIPILGSTLLIVLGKSQTFIGSSMLERQSGLSSGVHTLGHAMLFFSFVFAFYILMIERGKKSAEFRVIMLLFVLSVFCLYKSFTRTVLLGALIFWSIFLWRKNKKALLLLAAVGSLILLFYMAEVQNLIWQTRGLSRSSYDVNTASSGRVWIWEHNMKILSDQPITRIFLGVGLGHELDLVPESHMKWAGSHNDYLSLTIMLGVLGLFIYLLIYLASFITTIRSKISKDHKYLFVAITASVIVMNFVSNSYIMRFQMAQLFWLFIGLFISLQACEAGAQAEDSRRSR